jgi:hypothetical protein
MQLFVGMDVSQRLTHLCVVDAAGKRIWRGKCATDPLLLAETIREHASAEARVGIETGPLTRAPLTRKVSQHAERSVRPCVRPHMMIPPSIVFGNDDPRFALLPQVLPANLTSGGMIIPTTVPHSGREGFKGTAPLCEDGG